MAWPIVPASAHCNGTAASAFVYIGADTDLSVLHHLHCGEQLVLFVDPLTFWRNTEKIEQMLRSRDYDLDRLFECTDCVRPLHNDDVHRLSALITNALPRLPQQEYPCKSGREFSCRDCPAENQKVVGGPHVKLHDWKHWPGPYDGERSASSPIFEIRFEQNLQRRTMRYFAARAEDLDWRTVLGGLPVSTIAWVGAKHEHATPLLRHICHTQPGTPLRTFSTKGNSFQRICGDMGSEAVHEWTHLGCYCPLMARASLPCFGVSTFVV